MKTGALDFWFDAANRTYPTDQVRGHASLGKALGLSPPRRHRDAVGLVEDLACSGLKAVLCKNLLWRLAGYV